MFFAKVKITVAKLKTHLVTPRFSSPEISCETSLDIEFVEEVPIPNIDETLLLAFLLCGWLLSVRLRDFTTSPAKSHKLLMKFLNRLCRTVLISTLVIHHIHWADNEQNVCEIHEEERASSWSEEGEKF